MMKLNILFVALLLCSCNGENSNKNKENPLSSQNQYDQVNTSDDKIVQKTASEVYQNSLDILEDFLYKNSNTYSGEVINAINVLALLSGNEGSGDQTHFGTIGFSKDDLEYWKVWFDKNENALNFIYSGSPVAEKTALDIYKESIEVLEKADSEGKSLNDVEGFSAIRYLTILSGHKGNGKQNYLGIAGFSKEDVEYWKKWLKENKNSLNYMYIEKGIHLAPQ